MTTNKPLTLEEACDRVLILGHKSDDFNDQRAARFLLDQITSLAGQQIPLPDTEARKDVELGQERTAHHVERIARKLEFAARRVRSQGERFARLSPAEHACDLAAEIADEATIVSGVSSAVLNLAQDAGHLDRARLRAGDITR